MVRGTFWNKLPLPCANCSKKIKRVRDARIIDLSRSFVICKFCNPSDEKITSLMKLKGVTGWTIGGIEVV